MEGKRRGNGGKEAPSPWRRSRSRCLPLDESQAPIPGTSVELLSARPGRSWLGGDFPRDGAVQNPEGEGGIHRPPLMLLPAAPRSCPSLGCSRWEMGSCRMQPPGFCHRRAVPALQVTEM